MPFAELELGGRARACAAPVERTESVVETVSSVLAGHHVVAGGFGARGATFDSRRRRRMTGASETTIDRDFRTTNARVSDRKRPHVYSSSSSSSRGYGTEACPLQAKPVYPLLRARMLPTASSLTLKLHVRGCQDDQEENS